MRRGLRPAFRSTRRRDRVTDIFAISFAHFTNNLSGRRKNCARIISIRPRLLAADEKFRRAVKRWLIEIRPHVRFGCNALNGFRLPRRPCFQFQIFVDAFTPAFPAKAGFTVTAKTHSRIKKICRIHPNHAALQLGGDVESKPNGLAPHARRQSIAAIVGQHHRFIRRAEGHAHQHWPEDFFGRHRRRGFHIGEQRGREETARHGKRNLRLEFFSSLSHALFNQQANPLELDRINDGPHINGLVQRMANPELAHAPLQPLDEFGGHALLHQKPRSRAAHLPLIEPDGIDNPFNRAIKICIIKNDERRFAAELQRQGFSGPRRCLADQASHLGGTGKGDLVDARMLHKGRTRSPFPCHNIQNARRQAGLVGEFGKQQGRERRELRRLQDNRISGGQGRRNFPRQHQQWKIPWDNLAHNANCLAGG